MNAYKKRNFDLPPPDPSTTLNIFIFMMDDPPELSFSIGLFDIGNTNLCLISYFCTQCAVAQSRNFLDGSDFSFNCFCLPLTPYRQYFTLYNNTIFICKRKNRWLVRSAYGIGDLSEIGAFQDCLLSNFCCCCVTNQILQTTFIKGNPTHDGGAEYNHNLFIPNNNIEFGAYCYSLFCLPCSVGEILSKSIGMPFLMGCLCMNICNARNLVRYQVPPTANI
jgi:Cys-rich protein (TIGR01571 family)